MNESVSDATSSTGESDLRRWLGYGALAAVAATWLDIVTSALYLAGWPQEGFGLPQIISLAGLVPLGVVLAAYYKLSHQTGAPALRHSALALFGVVILWELAGLIGVEAAQVLILILGAIFVVWFAVAKIRLRRVLGLIAGAVGVAELFAILLLGLMLAGGAWETSQAAEQAGGDEQAVEANLKALETTYNQRFEVGSIVAHTVWAALTAGLFLSYRRRLALERKSAAVGGGETTSAREFSATGVYTGSWLVGGVVLVAASALLLVAWFPYHGHLKYLAALSAFALVAGLILCATALWHGNVRVQIDPDGLTLLDVDQRQTCRWDEVAELYERWLNTTGNGLWDMLWDLMTGWARGEHHMLTLVDRAGRRLELRNVVTDFPALVALVKRETLTRLLPAARAALSGGEALTFGPITIDRHEARVGDARLPWAEVESLTGDGSTVKVRKRGTFLTWAEQPLSAVPNAHVLIAVAQDRLKPREEAGAVDRGQGTAEPGAAADRPRD